MPVIDPFSTGGTVLNTISSLFKLVGKATKQSSLIEVSSPARVEPICVISNDCVNLDYAPDVMQSLQSVFTAYYLQAVALTCNISAVKATKVLDRLNPNRSDSITKLGSGILLSTESYKHKLPTLKMASEAVSIDNGTGVIGKDFSTITDLSNLSVGKLIEVTIKDSDNQTIKVPISIRLMVNQLSDKNIEHLLGAATNDTTFMERYHAWRSGRISFIKDLVLCQDLIDEHKKALLTDKAGVYTDISQRASKHKRTGVFDDSPSLASASNLFVISEAVAANIESKLGGKLSSPKIRDKIFSAGYGMIIVVIDREWERITFYHRGLATSTTMGIRDIKAANKGSNGPDIMDMMKAYSAGTNISF